MSAGPGRPGRPRRRRRPADRRRREAQDGVSLRTSACYAAGLPAVRCRSQGVAAVAAPPEATLAVTRARARAVPLAPRARLELDARPVAVFGPNGAGKTNLIEAVSLLSPGRGLRGAASEELARVPEPAGWKVTAELASPDGRHEVATWSEGPGRRVEIDGKPASQTALGAVARVLWLTPAMDRLWLEGASERRRFLDRVTLSLVPEHGEVGGRLRPQLAGAQPADPRRGARRRLVRRARGRRWRRSGRGCRRTGRRRWRGWRRCRRWATSRGPSWRSRARGRATRRGSWRRCARGAGATWRRGGASSGRTGTTSRRSMRRRGCRRGSRRPASRRRCWSAWCWRTRGRWREGFGAPPLLLLDEVAAHLDDGRRAALYDAVLGLGAQAWMTGTEPGLFDGLGDRVQRLRVAEAGGESRVERV